jgi:Protein of unknown function (DUF4435)
MNLEKTENLKENLDDYLASIELGGNKHLLVEGPSDVEVFRKLLDRLVFDGGNHGVAIQMADNLDISGQSGNRSKVEYVCKVVSQDQRFNSQRVIFAGFVDREFNKFDYEGKICDLLERHYSEECLFWSRGHSIENYFFEESIFIELFLDLVNVSWINQVTARFKNIFDEVVRLACAVGLAAHKLKSSDSVRRHTNFNHLKINGKKVSIDLQNWKEDLINKGESITTMEELAKYTLYSGKLTNVDIKVVKWLCDGHLGLAFILFAFCCCLEEVYPNIIDSEKPILKNLIDNTLGVKKKKFYLCANWWARRVQEQKCEYPKELFVHLGILKEGVCHLPKDPNINGKLC